MKKITRFLPCFLLLSHFGFAQDGKDTITDYSHYNRKLQTSVFFVGRYNMSMDDDVDFKGVQNSVPGEAVTNSFDMKYVRLQGIFNLNDKISTNVLVNLADFKTDSKVLENAFVKYAYDTHINVQFGQFRPFFGLEDVFAFQLENSYDWSNQYNLFGKSNWQSFQMGAALTGSLKKEKIPLNYYFTVYNGNGKNQASDNDNQKNYALRLEYFITPDIRVAANGASARVNGQTGAAYGGDVQLIHKLSPLFDLNTDAEYKRGNNFSDYYAALTATPTVRVDDYEMQGFYIVSKLRYNFNKPRVRAFEASFRYEILDPSINTGNSSYQTFTPVISVIGSGDYNAKISAVGVFNRYKYNIPDTSHYDSNIFILQIQVHF
ncbi:porin [Flavobacterium hauense]